MSPSSFDESSVVPGMRFMEGSPDLGLKHQAPLLFRVWGLGFRVQGSGRSSVFSGPEARTKMSDSSPE